MGGTETQASWPAPPSPPPTHPPAPPPRPPAPGHRGGSRAGAGGRGGRSEGGRGRREPGWEGCGGVGREKKKENIFRVPACRVSVRFGRKCVGYFGAVTWAGGLREAPGPSQPRVCAPPEPPITESPCHCDALSPRPPDAGTSGLGGLPSPSLPLQVSQAGKQARPPRTPGSSGEVGRGRGRREPRRLSSSPHWSGYPQGWRGASCPDLGVSPDVGTEWGRF